jgi:hypothetical protein
MAAFAVWESSAKHKITKILVIVLSVSLVVVFTKGKTAWLGPV